MDLNFSDDNNSARISESYDTAQRKTNGKNNKMMVKENTETDEEKEEKKKGKNKKKRKKGKCIDGSGSEDCKTVKKVKLAVKDKETQEEVEAEEDNANALSNFRISNVVKEKLKSKGILSLFPIQAMTYDIILDGSDLVGRARTGQGKTLAFVLPILESMTNGPLKSSGKTGYGRTPTVVVLLPTREFAKQVHADFEFYGAAVELSACSVYGGASMHDQQNTLKYGVDIIVGTPRRIKDLINRNSLDLEALKFCVLDEADEMFNMGFVDDVEFILGKVKDVNKVQTLLFSATMPDWVKKISTKFLKADKKTVDLVGNEKLKNNATVRHLGRESGVKFEHLSAPQPADVVKFEHISVPQPADIAESAGTEAADSISSVSDSVTSIFKSQAEQLLSTTGLPAIDLLAKALAKAAGYTDIKKRSLLSSMEGYVTLLLQAGRKPIHSTTFACSILRRFLPEEKVEAIKGLSLTANGMGAVFDVRTEDLDLFMDGKENASQVRLDVIEKLPNLQEKERQSGRRFGTGNGGGGRGARGGGFRFGGR